MIGETAEIGDRVTLYQGVTLGGTGFQRGKRHPTVEDNVTIGSGAKLLGPITVGHGAKVGANTVVIEDVPPNSTVVGNPGHTVRVEGRRPEGPDADWIHLPDPVADAIKALSRADRRARAAARRARRRATPEARGARAAPERRAVLGRRLRPPAPAARRGYPRSRADEPSPRRPLGRRRRADRARRDRVERLLAGLNQPQREAVEHGEGPLLVLAGAGSGKTRVLTHRIAYLLATGQARPGEILAITFTNKAASEMRERVEPLVGGATRVMWVMTFHSACARILRADAERLGYKRGFTIYDEADSRRMVKRCMDELEHRPQALPAAVDPARRSPAPRTGCVDADRLRARSRARSSRRRSPTSTSSTRSGCTRRTRWTSTTCSSARSTSSSSSPTCASATRRTFRHVLVDEYQDTNRAQYRLLQLLTGEHGNLFVVGDEAQSIYGFRAADIRNILDFERDFPEAEVVKLEQNYRSTQTILDAANAVIAHNRDRRDKHLWTELGGGEPVHDRRARRRARGGALGRRRDRAARSRRRASRRDDVAVFYRTNAQSRVLEDTLVRFDVPYQVIGGTKFYERAEIKDAIAYLSAARQPRRPVSLRRASSTRRGAASATPRQGRLLSHANTTGHADLGGRRAASRRSRASAPPRSRRSAASRETIAACASGPSSAAGRRAARGGALETGYIEALEAERTIEAEGRVENLAGAGRDGGRSSTPTASSRARASCRRWRSSSQQISLFTEQDELARTRR